MAEHDDNPEPAAGPRVIDRLSAAGLSAQRSAQVVEAAVVRAGRVLLTQMG